MFLAAILDVNGNIKVSLVVAITLMVTSVRLHEFARKKVNEYLENGRDMVYVESATQKISPNSGSKAGIFRKIQ